VQRILGGNVAETVLLLFTLAGATQLPRARSSPVARGMVAVAAIAVLTFAIAFVWSNVSSPAWALRYLCIVLAPAAVLLGAGLSRVGPIGAVVLAVVFLGSWYGKPTHASLAHKSNVAIVATTLGDALPAGEQVFSTQPEQVPLLRFYLPASQRYVTPLGPVPDPRVMDWRDAMKRLDQPAAAAAFSTLLDRLRPGERLLLVQPRFSNPSAPWTRRIRQITRRVHRDLAAHTEVRVVRSALPHRGYGRATVGGLLLERRRSGTR
jgi:hypothetical protein